MKVLIIGATGLLGKHLIDVIPNSVGTWFTNSHHSNQLLNLDICNLHTIHYVVDIVKPDVIIHCAGIGNVDYAERNYEETVKVNVTATDNLHKVAKDYDAQFVYISSNAVFGGNNPPYSETSKRTPVNLYGNIKEQAEMVVMAGNNWLIIRPVMLYGYPYTQGRQNMYGFIQNRLINSLETKLVNDVYWQPTNVKDAAKVIWKLIQESDTEQIYNIAPDEKPMTLYKFGKKIAKSWGLSRDLILPVDSNYFPTIAPRPVNTQYDVSKIKAMGIEMLKVDKGLRALK